LIDIAKQLQTETNIRKGKRFQLQSMKGQEIFMHFLDLHLEDFEDKDKIERSEYAEILLHEFVKQLTKLFTSCQNLPVPQMWLGSSVALGFDSGVLPSKIDEHCSIRKSVLVNIFDWGRSEFNTMKNFDTLSQNDQLRRNKYWNFYKTGIANLGLNAALEYKNRFGTKQWIEIKIDIFDFDLLGKDDILGSVTIPVEETAMKVLQLGNKRKGTLTYSMSWHPFDVSRLCGVWKVKMIQANELPNKDGPFGTSDPYCMLTARSEGGLHHSRQCTTVKANILNPVWNEEFEFPISNIENEFLNDALVDGGLDLPHEGGENLEGLFGCMD